MCNFGIYFILGLEAQLLSTVVRTERPELQEQKDGLVSAIAAARRQLLGLEDEILRYTQGNTVLCTCMSKRIITKSKIITNVICCNICRGKFDILLHFLV